MLFILNGAIHEVETRYRKKDGRKTKLRRTSIAIRIVAVILAWAIVVAFLHFYNYASVIKILASTGNYTLPYKTHKEISDEYGSTKGQRITNFTYFWESIRRREHEDFLYPDTINVDQVLAALRQAKVIGADLNSHHSSLMLDLTLEGNQSALFKVMLTNKKQSIANKTNCIEGCGHSEYDVAAFTLNRMFNLKNMPFTSGRILSWYADIEPVASQGLKRLINIQRDGSVCFYKACVGETTSTQYCFKNGELHGVISYNLTDSLIKTFNSSYHGYHTLGVKQLSNLYRLPGENTYCLEFRNRTFYEDNRWFLDIVDIGVFDFIMSNMDSKHMFYQPFKETHPLFNIMLDFKYAFCLNHSTPVVALAPLIQCCRIRTRLYKAMLAQEESFKDTFTSLTKDDPLYPILLPEVLDNMHSKLRQVLAYINICVALESESVVSVDI